MRLYVLREDEQRFDINSINLTENWIFNVNAKCSVEILLENGWHVSTLQTRLTSHAIAQCRRILLTIEMIWHSRDNHVFVINQISADHEAGLVVQYILPPMLGDELRN